MQHVQHDTHQLDQLLLTVSSEHWHQHLLPLLAAWLNQHRCGPAHRKGAICWLHALLLAGLLLSFCILLGSNDGAADLQPAVAVWHQQVQLTLSSDAADSFTCTETLQA
jgi:hypothetical protein